MPILGHTMYYGILRVETQNKLMSTFIWCHRCSVQSCNKISKKTLSLVLNYNIQVFPLKDMQCIVRYNNKKVSLLEIRQWSTYYIQTMYTCII